MNDEEMASILEGYHRTIRFGLDEIRRHCGASEADLVHLADARRRLTTASLARSRFVSEVAVPSLLKNADDALRTELSELLFTTAAKRMLSNGHIEGWTPTTIENDWAGYCAAAQKIRPMMEEQMECEFRILIARLKR